MLSRSIIKFFIVIISVFVVSNIYCRAAEKANVSFAQKHSCILKNASSLPADTALLFEAEDEDTDDDILSVLPLFHKTYYLINFDNMLVKPCTSFQYNSVRSILCSLAQLSIFRI